MSAFCGILHLDGHPVCEPDLLTMAGSSPLRGPDGCRIDLDGAAGFVHLAFHLSPESLNEHQPLVSGDGKRLLLADVRLDNRAALADELRIGKKHLPDLGDAHLLLAAFEAWGERCVDHLLGDFVFAVWNRESRELFLARDAMGAHSLAWRRDGNRFVFASEVTALLDLPGVSVQVNPDAVVKTLASIPLAEEETFFSGIQYIAPASCMLISGTRTRGWRYWQINPARQIRYAKADEYTDHLLELLEQAVACRLRSIGPIGISLSGGYDSTLLAAIAARQLQAGTPPARLKSFSYVFEQFSACDERRYIEPVVSQYGIDAHYINADGLWTFARLDERDVHRDHLWTNCYSQLPAAVAAAAQQAGCRVLLDGMFGDALFGEPGLFAADLIRQGRVATLYSLLRRHPQDIRWQRDIFQHGLRPLLPGWLRSAYRGLRPANRQKLAPGLTEAWLERANELAVTANPAGMPAGLSPAQRSRHQRIFAAHWAQGFAATRARPYNGAGLERLSPYFDRRLAEYVLAIPAEQLSHPGRPRRLQNEAMRRLLPEPVCTRSQASKTDFTPLLRHGLLQKELCKVRALARDSLMVKQGWVNADWLERQLNDPAAIEQDDFYLSTCLHLELWLRAIQPPLGRLEPWSANR